MKQAQISLIIFFIVLLGSDVFAINLKGTSKMEEISSPEEGPKFVSLKLKKTERTVT